MNRQAVVAGQFYPGTPTELMAQVGQYISAAETPSERRTLLAMAPHAGYVFSGAVAGATIGKANLADTVILLGPNHTGLGDRLAVWTEDSWLFPGHNVPVDSALAQAIIATNTGFQADNLAHAREHSLEVMLPFLVAKNPKTTIVPIAVSQTNPHDLANAAHGLAQAISASPAPVSILVSSDMSHYISAEDAKTLDSMALQAIVELRPDRLYNTVRENGITMCGVLPMTLGLAAAIKLGAQQATIVSYSNSGQVNGDTSRVVGYAGVIVD
ncbi:AmmeMemoRadiSam system protein B [Desulfovibrio inopinatus]|uniref:AmmeMemoRadiSam system protein B n=1 Tax=Desulfovibrio inopinatus TaxID=102109 RepID=UPI0003F54E7B|nr:AmmeMemoRadiSam system protein B [Desulfovibrio inopinatus]